tara:strand:+ start:3428 stop:4888 length:1461 start_codon:yes stop_codon:yes gene_type:complete
MISLKSLFRSSIIYGLGSALVRMMTFALVPLYTNAASAQEGPGWYGYYLLIFPIIGILRALYSHGSGDSFLKVYSENKNKEAIISTYLIHTISITLLISSILCSVYLLIPLSTKSLLISLILEHYFLILIIVAFDTINYRIMDILRIKNYPFYYIFSHLVGQLSTILLAINYVTLDGQGLYGALKSLIGGGIITFIIFIPILIKYINFKLFDFNYTKQFISLGLRFFPATVFFLLMMQLDRFFLHYLLPNSEPIVGAYGAAAKLASIPMLLISAFNLGWQPFYLTNGKSANSIIKYQKIGTIFAIVTIALAWIVAIIMPIISRINIPNIGQVVNANNYPIPDIIIPVIVISHVFYAFYIINMPSIYLCNKQNWSPIFRMTGAIVNIILNVILIPIFNMLGAAIATALSYGIMFMFLFYKNENWLKIRIGWLDILLLITLSSFSVSLILLKSSYQYLFMIMNFIYILFLLYKHGIKQIVILFSSNEN